MQGTEFIFDTELFLDAENLNVLKTQKMELFFKCTCWVFFWMVEAMAKIVGFVLHLRGGFFEKTAVSLEPTQFAWLEPTKFHNPPGIRISRENEPKFNCSQKVNPSVFECWWSVSRADINLPIGKCDVSIWFFFVGENLSNSNGYGILKKKNCKLIILWLVLL